LRSRNRKKRKEVTLRRGGESSRLIPGLMMGEIKYSTKRKRTKKKSQRGTDSWSMEERRDCREGVKSVLNKK